MDQKISVVINTFNERTKIEKLISSLRWADEVLVCDMHSDDGTDVLARKLGVRVVYFKKSGYVEPARNFAIENSSYDWVLILDADEEISENLVEVLKEARESDKNLRYIEIPRKNIIFNKWMQASFWWPDYQPRFFKKGSVIWRDEIHSKPKTLGQGLTLPAQEKFAIVHQNYNTVSEFILRMDRYTTIQADELKASGYKFDWRDLLNKPLSEFLSRFFANHGFEDGLHGLALSLLQAFSFLALYLKVWQMNEFVPDKIDLAEVKKVAEKDGQEVDYWFKSEASGKNHFWKIIKKWF